MQTLARTVKQAAEHLDRIIQRVCGACGETCCHQGTMMGSADLRRLYKGLLLEPETVHRLREGLRERSAEIREELHAVEQVTAALARTQAAGKHTELSQLEDRLADWRDFCDRLDHLNPLEFGDLTFLLRFSALRANALRVLREFPGAVEALSARSGPHTGFHPRGGRLAAPRCLFHLEGGCLAGPWKPAKCANFFCAGTPNLLEEVIGEMSFDTFVRANFRALSPERILRYLESEFRLGRPFVEPKVIVEPNLALREALPAALEAFFPLVERRSEPGCFMWSAAESEARLRALPEDMAYLVETEQVDGGALYELATVLDRLRVEGTPPALYLVADRLGERTFLPHPLWSDREMSQPLGFLDLLAVDLTPAD